MSWSALTFNRKVPKQKLVCGKPWSNHQSRSYGFWLFLQVDFSMGGQKGPVSSSAHPCCCACMCMMHPLSIQCQALLCILLLTCTCLQHSCLLKHGTQAHICMHFHGQFQVLHWVNYWGWNSAPFPCAFYSGTPPHVHSLVPHSKSTCEKKGGTITWHFSCLFWLRQSINKFPRSFYLSEYEILTAWLWTPNYWVFSFLGCDCVCNLLQKRPNYNECDTIMATVRWPQCNSSNKCNTMIITTKQQ